MSGNHVIAIPANPALANSIEDFLGAMSHNRRVGDAYVTLMDHMTDRVLGLCLVEPSSLLTLTSGQQKVIDFAVTTAGKASHMLTRQIFGKLDAAQLSKAADYVRGYFWRDGDDAFVRFPVQDDFVHDFKRAVELCAAGEGTRELVLVSSVMDRMTDDVMEALFIANTRNVKLGFVTQKALSVGSEASRKALHAVNHKVLKSLDNEALKGFMAHYASLVRLR